MSFKPKTDPETLEFFQVLHRLLSTHPNKELVQKLHLLRSAPGVKQPYLESAWLMFGKTEA